jgi:hypothetical protein
VEGVQKALEKLGKKVDIDQVQVMMKCLKENSGLNATDDKLNVNANKDDISITYDQFKEIMKDQ